MNQRKAELISFEFVKCFLHRMFHLNARMDNIFYFNKCQKLFSECIFSFYNFMGDRDIRYYFYSKVLNHHLSIKCFNHEGYKDLGN